MIEKDETGELSFTLLRDGKITKLLIYFAVRLSIFVSLILVWSTLYRYWKRRKSYSKLPTYKGLSYIGYFNLLRMSSRLDSLPPMAYFFQVVSGICHLYHKEGLALIWIMFKPFVFVYKAEIIKDIISHPSALDKPREYDAMKKFFGTGLISSNGKLWESHRKLINPAFHKGILREYIHIFNEQAVILIKKLKEEKDESWVNISEYLISCTFDTIWGSTMGIHMGCQQGNHDSKQYMKASNEMDKIAVYKMVRPWLLFETIVYFTPTGRRQHKLLNITQTITQKIILEKKRLLNSKEGSNTSADLNFLRKRKSFIETLLKCSFHNPQFTLKDVESEVNTIIAAGYVTSSLALRWALFLLGLHQDVQNKAIQELDEIFEGRSSQMITYKDLNDMKYIDCIIKETLRLYPSVPIAARVLKDDVETNNYVIPKGTVVAFAFHMLHKDPQFFPEPEKFIPERFFPENSSDRHPFAYLPFSTGTRNCIGQRFALLELKVILGHILRNFTVKALDQRDKIRVSWEISLKNVDDIRIHLTQRQSFQSFVN